ncbi:MAG: hypothetical protein GY711_06115 [bacterium]|nr:hypothetical protein [bacterium]
MRISYTTVSLAGMALALCTSANAQEWTEDFDDYSNGDPVDPGGQASIGNNWESWSAGAGSSIVVGQAPAPFPISPPNSLANLPGADTVANWSQQEHPTSGRWVFAACAYNSNQYQGRTLWIMLNTYSFGGPYNWSIQVTFDGNQNVVDCDCAGANDPNGPQDLIRNTWMPIRGQIDLDNDFVDVSYNGNSLTGGQGYSWTGGVFGAGGGNLAIQALDLFPDVSGAPNTTAMFYDEMYLEPQTFELGQDDPQCNVIPNSTGLPAQATLLGSGVAGDDIRAFVVQGPPGGFGYFITGPISGLYIVPPGSVGTICIATPAIYRYSTAALGQVFQFDGAGESIPTSPASPGLDDVVVLPTDGSYAPVPAVGPGESRAFQAWYRDAPTSNFSNSVRVNFQ